MAKKLKDFFFFYSKWYSNLVNTLTENVFPGQHHSNETHTFNHALWHNSVEVRVCLTGLPIAPPYAVLKSIIAFGKIVPTEDIKWPATPDRSWEEKNTQPM